MSSFANKAVIRTNERNVAFLTEGGHSQRCHRATLPGNLRNIIQAPTDAIFRWKYRCKGQAQMGNRTISIVCGVASIVAARGFAFAADMAVNAPPPASPPAVWDWSGFYIGAGGSFNWTHFDQSIQGVSGTINVVNSLTGELIFQGQEGGPFFDFNRNRSGFAPDAQLGYMAPFAGGGDWLVGLKFTYKYATSTRRRT